MSRFATRNIPDSILFNANGEEVTIANGGSFDPSATDWTLFTWTNFNNLGASAYKTIFAQNSGGGTGRTWFAANDEADSTDIITYLNGTEVAFSNFAVKENTWYRFAFVHDNAANTITMYVDGKIRDTVTALAPDSADGTFILGENRIGSAPTFGESTAPMLYSDALTADQIASEYNDNQKPTGTQVFDLPFTEGVGNPQDISGNGNNGTLVNATWTGEPVFQPRTAIS